MNSASYMRTRNSACVLTHCSSTVDVHYTSVDIINNLILLSIVIVVTNKEKEA